MPTENGSAPLGFRRVYSKRFGYCNFYSKQNFKGKRFCGLNLNSKDLSREEIERLRVFKGSKKNS
ncbi:TPA: hypothetical protein DCG82_05580 [candidate division WOR-3]|uniref:Uncharacterized protein n=1 Tax=candidate division WOR-3 bacterium TaxID=2052148 RepID=A0A348MLC8_UNCW3|nr:hypothetical protein [candidate division WOR-3 bacterium]HCP17372.1 hypothetical protein [candidate division WOR-3 bacterium]